MGHSGSERDGSPAPRRPAVAAHLSVTPRLDGPLVIEGPVALVGPDGTTGEVVARLFMCRCGSSADKPHCDGTHKRVGFAAAGVEPARKPGP